MEPEEHAFRVELNQPHQLSYVMSSLTGLKVIAIQAHRLRMLIREEKYGEAAEVMDDLDAAFDEFESLHPKSAIGIYADAEELE